MAAPAAPALVKLAVAFRKPLTKLIAFILVAPAMFIGVLVAMTAGLAGAAQVTDKICETAEATAQSTLPSPVTQAAANLRLGPAATIALGVLTTTAITAIPTPTINAAGPYRLPAAYAAGNPAGTGQWRGPIDPLMGSDSRSDPRTATRAVVRKLQRSTPTWAELRTAQIPANDTDKAALAAQFATAFAAAFTHLAVPAGELATAFNDTPTTASPAGDTRAGGTLIIGDPARVEEVFRTTGPRLFSGAVEVAPTAADPATVTAGADRDLAAARGLVIAVTATTPTAGDLADLDAGTPGDVVWIAAAGVPDVDAGVWVASTPDELKAAVAAITATGDATANFFSVCVGVPGVGDQQVIIDPSLIDAPDPAAAQVIAYAHEQLGEAYVGGIPGAKPPVTWDCSKLTTAAWAAAGVKITPYSFSQLAQTTPIGRNLVAPGDLVFWLRGSVHHVALVDEVKPDGTIWITEAANPDVPVRRRAIGGGWDETYLTSFGRVQRST